MAKPGNKSNNTNNTKDMGVKYSDPRMAFLSTHADMAIQESENIKMKDIFGEDIVCKNAPVVLCEDQNGLYLTSKINVGVPFLDGYRQYQRHKYQIVKNEDKDKVTYKVIKDNKEYNF